MRLEAPVGGITYPIGSGLKTVHYWRASAIESSPRPPDAEVDKIAWVPVRTALARTGALSRFAAGREAGVRV